jgi:hypothetical protein
MPIIRLSGNRGVLWEPTTDLLCTYCREPIDIYTLYENHENWREVANFMFEFGTRGDDPLSRGEYFYLHKRCARIEGGLIREGAELHWGWHPIGWVLGIDKTMLWTAGNLGKHLKKRMPPGVYDRLYEAWLPAIKPAKSRPSRAQKAASPVVRAERLSQAQELREVRKLASRFVILQRDQFRCRLCGKAVSDGEHVRLEVDHIIPRSKGGKDTAENKWVLCFECNRGKGTRLL